MKPQRKEPSLKGIARLVRPREPAMGLVRPPPKVMAIAAALAAVSLYFYWGDIILFIDQALSYVRAWSQ